MLRVIRRAVCIAAFLPVIAQPPRVYFSISSDRTFAPGEKARVTYSSQNVDSLEFRVYRVNDPLKFFRQMQETHSFGGQAPPAPKARTLLERMHQWKQRTRYSMRRTVRRQFGDEEHFALVRFFNREAREIPKGPGGDRYAEVPLLNPQQLVRSWRVNMDRKNPWDSRAVDFDLPGSGLYIVEATDGNLRAATIVNATQFVVLKKTVAGRLIVQVVDRNSGAPVDGVGLQIIQGPADIAEVATGASGTAEVPVKLESERSMMMLARKGNELAVAPLEFWSLREQSSGMTIGYVYTDRPIYRPTHKVGFRAILRGESPAGWKMPEAGEISCEITNPEGQVVDRRSLKLSEFGTVNGEWTIPSNAPLGYYSIVLRAGESTESGSFQVEEYRKPEYEVKVQPAKPRILQGASAEFQISATYFFGEPVAAAKMKYTVRKVRYWMPWWGDFEAEDFEDGEGEGYNPYGEQIAEAETRLDAKGIATVLVPTKLGRADERYLIEARVTDEANREVAGRGGILATVGDFALLAIPDKYVYAPGERATITVEARNYDGGTVPNVAFTVTLDKSSARGTTGADGKGTAVVAVPGAGSWKADVRANSAGRTVREDAYIWVSGAFRDEGRGQQITLVPDQKSYKPGQTAKVLVVTNVPGTTVLMGVEGRGLYKSEVKKSAATSFVYEVPIDPEYAPNIFVTAAFVKDGKYYQGSKSLKVPATDKIFDVEITPSKPQFKPGEPASYTVLAKDSAGKPVQAEFSLGVVDEALYGVEPDRTPGIDKAFYGPVYNRVQTESSLQYYFYGQAGKRAMPIAQLRRGTLAQVKPPNIMDPRVRKAFPDTALWLATLKTGADGKANATLQFPDSITAWRATARGVTRDTRVGGAVNRVITRKDLILRVAAPRFLTEGDEVTISAIVNNYLKSALPVNVTLDAQGVGLLDGRARQGEAAADGATVFDFRVRATGMDKAVLTVKALGAESDALEIELPIRPYGVPITEAHAGTLTDSGSISQDLKFPPESRARSIEIRTMPSLAGALFGALEYLNTYPYGCTEQTLSSFVPNGIVQRAMDELKLPARVDRARLRKQINAGLARLAELQHPDGGWGFWESDDSGAFMTANVLAALNEFGEWGSIDLAKAKTWLRKTLATEKRLSPDFLAFAAYATREGADLETAWKVRESMTPYGLAILGLQVQGERASEIAGRLTTGVTSTEAEAYWKCERDTLMDIDWDASPEATAYAVKFLGRLDSANPLLPKAARWLVNHRNDGYYWASTKQTAMVIYGLTDYVKQSGELDPKLQVIAQVNGDSVYNKELLQADALAPHSAGVRVLPKTENATVKLMTTGTGRLYWSMAATRYEDRQRTPAARGDLSVTRQYFRRVAGGALTAFDGVAKAGDEIVSRVVVSGGEWKYLLVEDPIPAGGEWSKERVAGQWVHRELRDDRAAMFETYFRGSRTYESVIKLNRPGKFRVSPARVSPMYQPSTVAYSDAMTIEVMP